jgi:predicted small integral membrane protein
MLAIIIVLEITAGAFAAKGAFDLWRVRRESAARFDAAKSNALIGTALGVVVWFGIFSAVGGAYFQMWQTELGRGSLRDASMFSLQMAALWLIIYAPDRDTIA